MKNITFQPLTEKWTVKSTLGNPAPFWFAQGQQWFYCAWERIASVFKWKLFDQHAILPFWRDSDRRWLIFLIYRIRKKGVTRRSFWKCDRMHRATQIALQIGVKRVVSHVTEKCISLFTRRNRPLIEITRFRIFAFEKIGKLLNKFFVKFQKKKFF